MKEYFHEFNEKNRSKTLIQEYKEKKVKGKKEWQFDRNKDLRTEADQKRAFNLVNGRTADGKTLDDKFSSGKYVN